MCVGGITTKHDTAWQQVADKLNAEIQSEYTWTQCRDQFENQKKKWKVSVLVL